MGIHQDDEDLFDKVAWLGKFSDDLIGLDAGSPAQILQHILEKKWTLAPDDRDMIVMWHKFVYRLAGEEKQINSSMVMLGENNEDTAMSLTVGLPLAIVAKLILKGKIKRTGVELPIHPEVYGPVLEELAQYGCQFNEQELTPDPH